LKEHILSFSDSNKVPQIISTFITENEDYYINICINIKNIEAEQIRTVDFYSK